VIYTTVQSVYFHTEQKYTLSADKGKH